MIDEGILQFFAVLSWKNFKFFEIEVNFLELDSDNLIKRERKRGDYMKINNFNAINQIYRSNSTSAMRRVDSAQSFSDRLEFSKTAKSYTVANSAVSSAPDVRLDKVNAIKAQMAAGTYNVSAEDVADKILSDVSSITF